MSLDQAIKHGKEKRKPFHGPKSVDAWCRNHGRCWVCRRNRLHRKLRDEIITKSEIDHFKKASQILREKK
ncbi:hypothetical protein IKD67_01875 [Candidatus Saccharibacteria bacterium]|nr:hypothetical protein [Candidatus Saccharibacteria bacterium]